MFRGRGRQNFENFSFPSPSPLPILSKLFLDLAGSAAAKRRFERRPHADWKSASVVGEARSQCHSGASLREPQAHEARSGQVHAQRTLRLTGKSATADFRQEIQDAFHSWRDRSSRAKSDTLRIGISFLPYAKTSPRNIPGEVPLVPGAERAGRSVTSRTWRTSCGSGRYGRRCQRSAACR